MPLSLLLLLLGATFATVALILINAVVFHNFRHFPRLAIGAVCNRTCSLGADTGRAVRAWKATETAPTSQQDSQEAVTEDAAYPPISVLIPARNEAAVIGQTVGALLAQQYPNIEVIVLDDHSTDATAQVATAVAAGDPRFRLISGAALPTGWGGKNWACHQLVQAARHDLLLFTDADVQWRSGALTAVTAMQAATQADLLTVWPTQLTESWGERLIVPLMSFAVLAYLPVTFAHNSPYPQAAAANGQCLFFRRQAYQTCGGHTAVRNRVLEDVLLAQRIKAAGLRLRMADGAGLVACRMYHSWQETLHGYAKNILAGHGSSMLALVGSTLFHLLLFVAPWLWLIAGGVGWRQPGWPWWPLTLILLGYLARGMTAYSTNQRLRDTLWLPLSVLLMTRIALHALWWRIRYGGPQWKGRRVVG
jgi:chlorobactene glucosyltransferase